MSKDYKSYSANKKKSKKKKTSGNKHMVMWLVVIALIAIFVAGLYWLSTRTAGKQSIKKIPVNGQTKKKPAPKKPVAPKIKFEFYNLLPKENDMLPTVNTQSGSSQAPPATQTLYILQIASLKNFKDADTMKAKTHLKWLQCAGEKNRLLRHSLVSRTGRPFWFNRCSDQCTGYLTQRIVRQYYPESVVTLTELKYIVAVAQERNFGRAAEKCFVSQPTLSVAVKKLEDELDILIFERLKSEVLITPVGEKIIQQAQNTLDQAAKVKELAKNSQDELTDVLRLGAIYTVGPYVLPTLIPALSKAAPDMPLIIQEDYTKNLTQDLLQGQLDVIIIAMPYEANGITVQPLYQEPLKVIMPATHAWVKEKAIKPEQLTDETVLLLGEGHCFRDDVLRACPRCGINAKASSDQEKMLEGGSLETIRHMVASGLGVSVLPESALNLNQYAENYLISKPFTGKQPVREVALAYRQSYPRKNIIHLLQTILAH